MSEQQANSNGGKSNGGTIKTIQISGYAGKRFFLPLYQRGYRWQNQVRMMLEDIDTNNSYCFPPVIVKKKIHEDGEQIYELVDGQQRIITLSLIFEYLDKYAEDDKDNEIEKITFEYKQNEDGGNNENEQNGGKKNLIDNFFEKRAKRTIESFFQNMSHDKKNEFRKKLLGHDFTILWYELNSEDNGSAIFERINAGKIALSCAEIIKAHLLSKKEDRHAKILLAYEWEHMEQQLSDDQFWYFITHKNLAKKYQDKRIEYLFDISSGKTKKDDFDPYFTYTKLLGNKNNETEQANKDNEAEQANKVWEDARDIFRHFMQWYMDSDLFHQIGFLIESGNDENAAKTIKDLVALSKNEYKNDKKNTEIQAKTKAEFKNEIMDRIREIICPNESIANVVKDAEYGLNNDLVKKLLFLFNVETHRKSMDKSRFNFAQYKQTQWDIEHIHSQTDDWGKSRDVIIKFLEEINDQKEEENKQSSNTENNDNAKNPSKNDMEKLREKITDSMIDELRNAKEEDKFKEIIQNEEFKDIRNILDGNNSLTDDNVNHIGNLVLLDRNTNRSYKNSPYIIKRKILLNIDDPDNTDNDNADNINDRKYLLVGTRYAFVKYYTKSLYSTFHWTNTDAKDYMEAIENTLSKLLGETNGK